MASRSFDSEMEQYQSSSSPRLDASQSSQGASAEVDYAFLNQSQASIGHGEGDSMHDNQAARQRRRRTSPEDYAILEAEYERNPKPDKATRQSIVGRVALGEKEVQIWFQNRRQMTRRKSKPTENSDHDHRESMDSYGCAAACRHVNHPVRARNAYHLADEAAISQHDLKSREASLSSPSDMSQSLLDLVASDPCHGATHKGTCQTFKVDSKGTLRPREPADLFKAQSQFTPKKHRPGYFANRRSAPFIVHDDCEDGQDDQSGPSSSAQTWPAPKDNNTLRRTASLVKLSLDSEGKAEVTPRTGDTPSPPHATSSNMSLQRHRKSLGLQRSLSALEPGYAGHSMASRKPKGWSRDARTWEFYCDSTARNALTEQAEKAEGGSAAAAIGLIRSRSQNAKVLTPNANKRNAHVNKGDHAKRLKAEAQKRSSKPPLLRASSSIARLQGSKESLGMENDRRLSKPTKAASSLSSMVDVDDGDSDKENWKPGTQARPESRRRPVTSQETARVLLESLREPSRTHAPGKYATSHLQPTTSRAKAQQQDKENINANKLMTSGQLPKDEADLDCVQNLLSLRQAVWR